MKFTIALAIVLFAASASASTFSYYSAFPHPYALNAAPLAAINPYALTYPYNPYFPALRFADLKHHTPEHKEEKDGKPADVAEIKAAPLNFYTGLPLTYSYPAPLAAPLALPATHQYHSQDELGQYQYGYNTPLSSKTELKTFDGITRGAYSYVDSEGKLQSVNYVSDALRGFRVAATNLPEAPKAPIYEALAGPMESAEIIEARRQHLQAHEDARIQLESAKSAGESEEKKEE